jgi:D-alanyl-D-alanine carboxypeptidase
MRLRYAVVLLIPTLAGSQAPSYARERARMDSLISAEVANTPIAGLAVAVVKGRDTILSRAWGFADVENEVPVTTASVFRIGSITKQFTSSAIMQLVEKGRLSLDDTLGALLPNMPVTWRKVTLRQLLNHTSGIASYTNIGPRWERRWREDMMPDFIVGFVTRDKPDFEPGSKWRYNNTGYVLLGMILDKATGQLYPRYLSEQFFKPMGLSSTMYCETGPIIKHRALGYQLSGKQLSNAEFLSMTQPYSAGALCSTVGDLVKWTRALHSGAVVSAASLKQMTTPIGAAAASHYGFGLASDSLGGHRRVSHAGGIHGFVSMLAHYPDDSLTIVVLANSVPAPVGPIAANLARIMFGMPPETRPAPRGGSR